MQLFRVNDVQTGASCGFDMGAVRQDGHLPFSMPDRSFAISQQWRELTFMHWKVDPERLKPHLPDGLEIDLFVGDAWMPKYPCTLLAGDCTMEVHGVYRSDIYLLMEDRQNWIPLRVHHNLLPKN